MAVSFCFLVLLVLVRLIVAQAPGDGDELCLSELFEGQLNPFFNNPNYAANARPLMDSKDYIGLLQGQALENLPWLSVDIDNNNDDELITAWSQARLDLCNGTVSVCGFPAGAQENWLITQHISRVLPGGQRLRKVTAQFDVTLNGCDISRECRQSYDVYIWQTSTINRTAARNTESYIMVDRVSPDGFGSSTNFVEIDLNAEDGFYLAVVDFSTCMTINHLIVLYYVCPEETSQLISRPETIQSVGGSASVNGECVENSSTESMIDPVVRCDDIGQWEVVIPCLCNPGYEFNKTQDHCAECPVGSYSDGVSNDLCESCPANSEATETGLAECPCIQNYYRAPDEKANVSCARSPTAPRNLTVSNVTNTSVILSWLPPQEEGGRNFSGYTITATSSGAGSVTVELSVEVSVTDVVLTRLTPGANYILSVTAENAVSSQDTTSRNVISISARTAEGVAGTVTEISVSDGTVVSWSPPVPPNGIILYYNIRITRADNGELVRSIEELNVLTIDVSDYIDIDTQYNVTVQAVTEVGAGDFSSPPVTVMLVDSSDNPGSTSAVLAAIVSVLVVIIGALSVIATVLSIFIYRLTRKTRSSTPVYEVPNKRISVDYEVPAPMIPASDPPLHLNVAYLKVPAADIELTDNVAYSNIKL